MIPDFQTLMLPFLKNIKDGKEYSTAEILQILTKEFNLSLEELEEYLPSGNQKVFYNRVFWAKAHLKMAGLIENIKRGYFKITDNGLNALKSNPKIINLKFLKQFPLYIENTGKPKEIAVVEIENENENESKSTPEEILESNYLKIRKNLALELLLKVKTCSPSFFENLVVELLVKMGYGGSIKDAGKSIGRSGDEGIDGIIKEDKLGLDIIYIQAKRWENVVGRPEIQKFVGALAGQGAKKGVFITTARFTNDAKDYQPRNETKIVLIDGEQLADLMIEYDLAVSISNQYIIKRIDNDYFEEIN
ncbi:MAG: restriction endonuclease [Paludibacter sp.]